MARVPCWYYIITTFTSCQLVDVRYSNYNAYSMPQTPSWNYVMTISTRIVRIIPVRSTLLSFIINFCPLFLVHNYPYSLLPIIPPSSPCMPILHYRTLLYTIYIYRPKTTIKKHKTNKQKRPSTCTCIILYP